jgi:hypothetical protein
MAAVKSLLGLSRGNVLGLPRRISQVSLPAIISQAYRKELSSFGSSPRLKHLLQHRQREIRNQKGGLEALSGFLRSSRRAFIK